MRPEKKRKGMNYPISIHQNQNPDFNLSVFNGVEKLSQFVQNPICASRPQAPLRRLWTPQRSCTKPLNTPLCLPGTCLDSIEIAARCSQNKLCRPANHLQKNSVQWWSYCCLAHSTPARSAVGKPLKCICSSATVQ